MTDALFDVGLQGAALHPVHMVATCPRCGKDLGAVPIRDAADDWYEPSLWCYLAQKNHDADCEVPA